MKRRLKEPFGKAGLIVAAIALIFALTGGALAATGNNPLASSSKAKQGKPGKRGPKGPKGDTGATGAAGTNGTNGKDGAPGAKGENGTNGTNGTDGKSVVTTAITTAGLEGKCTGVGGTKFQVEGSATKEYVCNGKEGTFGSQPLPTGQTLTGVWAAEGGASGDRAMAVISFPLHLTAAPKVAVAPLGASPEWYEFSATASTELRSGGPGEEFGEVCEGSVSAPSATSGFLCVYTKEESAIGPPGFEWFSVARVTPTAYGIQLPYKATGAPGFVYGTWAVTAP